MKFLVACLLFIGYHSEAQISLILYSGKFKSVERYQKFKVVEVIDARLKKENIGLIYDFEAQKVNSVNPQKELQTTLFEYIDRCQNTSKEQKSIILKINYLEFSNRKTEKRKYVWAFCDYSVYLQQAEGVCEIARKTCAVEGLSGDNGISSDLSKINWLLWSDIFDQMNRINFKNEELAFISRNILTKPISTPKIIFTDFLLNGIYQNYEEFLQNNPFYKKFRLTIYKMSPAPYGAKSWEFQTKENISDTFQKIKTSRVWGYCKDSRVFVKDPDNKQFFEIEPLGTTFEIDGIVQKPNQTINTENGLAGLYLNSDFNMPGNIVLSANNTRFMLTEKGWTAIPIYILDTI